MFMQSGTIGVSRDDVMRMAGECCPNDGEPMRRETWHERAESNYKWGVDLMEQIIGIAKADSLPQAIERLREATEPRPPAAAVDLRAVAESLVEFQRIYQANTSDTMPGNEHYAGMLMKNRGAGACRPRRSPRGHDGPLMTDVTVTWSFVIVLLLALILVTRKR